MEFREIERNQQKRFFTAIRLLAIGKTNFGFYIASGFLERFRKQLQIFVRTLDTVKWRFGSITHVHALLIARSLLAGGSLEILSYPLFSHNCNRGGNGDF